jgi:hypothetical protein
MFGVLSKWSVDTGAALTRRMGFRADSFPARRFQDPAAAIAEIGE